MAFSLVHMKIIRLIFKIKFGKIPILNIKGDSRLECIKPTQLLLSRPLCPG